VLIHGIKEEDGMSKISPEISGQIAVVNAAIFGAETPTINIVSDGNHPYSVDWDNHAINFSLKADAFLENDIDVAIHEMAHFMIASSDGLHLQAWGMKNPYVFWDGREFNNMPAPDGSPASNTETKVWAWQHLIYVMSGLREIDDVDKRPEAQWVGDAPRHNMLETVDSMIRKHLSDIYEAFPNGTWADEIRRKFKEIPALVEFESTQKPHGEFSPISETPLGCNTTLILEHNDQGWFNSILVHEGFDGYKTYYPHLLTRSPERVQSFSRVAANIFDERPFIERPHLVSVSSEENLESISENGFHSHTYFIDSAHEAAQSLVEYYSECLRDEGKTPIVLAVEKNPAMLRNMEPDYPSIQEPIAIALDMSDDEVRERWEGSEKSTEDCLSIVGSCRSINVISASKIVVLENDKDTNISFYLSMQKDKKKQVEMTP